MLPTITLPLAIALLTQSPETPIPKATEKKIIAASGDLNPFPKVSRENLVKASQAQSLSNTDELERAWHFYSKFRGAWSPTAPKPDPKDLAVFEQFSKSLKAHNLPKWATSNSGSSEPRLKKLTLDPSDPDFKALCQTSETQFVKALCLVYLTEHELDQPGAYAKGANLLYLLTEQTPFDPDARLLFAKAGIDAKDYDYAFYNARIGLYLSINPSQNDLEFFCFVGAFTGKDKWPIIQNSIHVLANSEELAQAVISKQSTLFGPNARNVTAPTKEWKAQP